MNIQIARATADDLPGIRALNQRLTEGRAGFLLPDAPELLSPSPRNGPPARHEFFVARERDAVRGGYLFKREPLCIGSERSDIWNYQLPLSEGIVNRAHAMVGIQLLQDAMKRSEQLYCLGMGSLARPLPRLLNRFHWTVETVPFLFRVIHSSGFLRHITYIRERKHGAALAAAARLSGLGALATGAWRFAAGIRQPRMPGNLRIEQVAAFGSEVDELFWAVQPFYGALIERTTAVLNARYPKDDERLVRLLAYSSGKLLGWVILTRSNLHHHKQFGSMRLGCIVDGFCAPELAPTLIRLATDRLIAERVDLIVSNQTHAAWIAGLRRCGFVSGPSNFQFARSPALATRSPPLSGWYMNRGDGDGPINL